MQTVLPVHPCREIVPMTNALNLYDADGVARAPVQGVVPMMNPDYTLNPLKGNEKHKNRI